MPRPRPDYVYIRLSSAGLKMAGKDGVVRWANGRKHFSFKAGEAQEVERSYEWNHILRHETFEGNPILEEAPDEKPTALPKALKALVAAEPGEGD